MQVSLSRRAMFKGGFSKAAEPVHRPPWAVMESRFLDLCSRCDACVEACGEGILGAGGGGYPEIDFKRGECTFCADCAEACETGALARTSADVAPWTLRASIGGGCISAQGVTCRVCGDRCDARAIQFKLAPGGIANPVVDLQVCTGCGACVLPCPTGAIQINPIQSIETEEISA